MDRLLSCSEIWGGGDAIDTSFLAPGMHGALFSKPLNGPRGGDIYLLSSCEQGVVCKVVLADVSGHGEEVARLGEMLIGLLRANVGERDNDRFLDQLNSQFEVETDLGVVFATLACGTYFIGTRQFHFAYAGHPHIILGRDGHFQPLSLTPGCLSSSPGASGPPSRGRFANLPIGVSDQVEFHEGCIELRPNDWLILFSDGLIEAHNQNGQQYGLARLLNDLKRVSLDSPMAVKNGLLTRMRDFVAPRPFSQDDLTLIVLRLLSTTDRSITRMAPELAAQLARRGRPVPAAPA